MFNFAGRRMSGFEVIVGGGDLVAPTPPPLQWQEPKKKEARSE